MEITTLKKSDEEEWDDFVMKSKDSTFYHQIGWRKVVEKTYSHKSIYLLAREDDKIEGILPLFLMKSRFFGNKLISVPFGPYGGVCANNELIENMLINEAKTITHEMNADYLELRYRDLKSDLITKKTYSTFVLDLNPDPEVLWNNLYSSTRRGVKRAIKRGLEFATGIENIDEGYALYSQRMRELGSPTHSPTFFKNLLSEFPKDMNLFIVRKGETMIGTLFMLFFRDTAIGGWGASSREYFKYYPNNLLYWKAIAYCCKKNYKFFDFGRSLSQGSGNFEFKTRMGAKHKQLYYLYYLNRFKHIPDTTQSNPKRQMFAKIWKKLPRSVTVTLGPKLRRNFP